MNILVTGGAGFIASAVVDQYIRKGHKVWVLDNISTGKKMNLNPKAHFKKMDICNKPALVRFFKGKKFDVVNHHAAQIDVRLSVRNPVFDAKVNILGLLNVLDLSRSHKVKKFIFASSGGTIYGECRRPAREGNPEIPLSPYGVSKLASEKYLQTFGALFGLNYTIFRYGNVYGPRQNPLGEAGVVAIFSNRFLKGRRCDIFGNGKQTRDYVYVEDVAEANALALKRGNNQIFNIGSGTETSVLKIYNFMSKLCEVKKKPIFRPPRPGELNRSVLNVSKVRAQMGWKPKTKLSDGLIQTVGYFSDLFAKGSR